MQHNGSLSEAAACQATSQTKRAAGKPAALKGVWKRRLFGGDFSRRVECAGIVDLRDLMVGEAQYLAQDFVGVFAE